MEINTNQFSALAMTAFTLLTGCLPIQEIETTPQDDCSTIGIDFEGECAREALDSLNDVKRIVCVSIEVSSACGETSSILCVESRRPVTGNLSLP